MGQMIQDDTIVALATPPGTGGIGVVRVSGPEAVNVVARGWTGCDLEKCASHTVHLGTLMDTEREAVDQCVATVFRSPKSYTGEDTVELALHGSPWIQRRAVETLISYGARPAGPGEFTRRAFLNGRLDLAQAEGVADLISASSRAAHRLAMQQASGGFSRKIDTLRERLIEFAALLELELDFSEEDVEFADRTRLLELARTTRDEVASLAATFDAGQAFKAGVPVVIAGVPNAGKSTLLNRLLREDKAIVTPIAGTTRDILEDTVEIGGILFRFIDTAGLHESTDEVERIGIDRARDRIARARILIWMLDTTADLNSQLAELRSLLPTLCANGTRVLLLLNKSDITSALPFPADSHADSPEQPFTEPDRLFNEIERVIGISHETGINDDETCKGNEADISNIDKVIRISAETGEGLPELESTLTAIATSEHNPDTELIVTNARHAEALRAAADSLTRAIDSLETGFSADLTAMDIRQATAHLSELTGALTTDTLLHHIFAHFCIGK